MKGFNSAAPQHNAKAHKLLFQKKKFKKEFEKKEISFATIDPA